MRKIYLCLLVFFMIFSFKSNMSNQLISFELDQICLSEFVNCLSCSNEYFNKKQFEESVRKRIKYYFISLDNLTLKEIEYSYNQTYCQIKVLYQYYFITKKIIKEVGVNERKSINANCYYSYSIM